MATMTERKQPTRHVEPVKGRAIFTTGQIAKICKVAPRTVSKWFDAKKLKGYRIPGSLDRRVPRANLIEFLRENNMPLYHLEAEETVNVLTVGCNAAVIAGLAEYLPAEDGYRHLAEDSAVGAGFAVGEFQPDAVIVCLSVGRGTAKRVAQRLRHVAAGGDCPLLVALTGEDDAEPDALVGGGFFDEVRKSPVDAAELAELIRTTTGGD